MRSPFDVGELELGADVLAEIRAENAGLVAQRRRAIARRVPVWGWLPECDDTGAVVSMRWAGFVDA